MRDSKKKKPEEPEARKKRETTLEFLASMAVVLVTGLFILTFNLQAFEIPSSSMENTLLIGDHVFVDRSTYAPATRWTGPVMPYHEVRDGDIVVFVSPSEAGLYVVKRIIGIPGDRIHLKDGVVYRNGQPLSEPYVIRSIGDSRPYRDNFPAVPPTPFDQLTADWEMDLPSHLQNGELVVPPDSFFGMGDNRDASYDSRYWGFIPRQNIIGRPMFIYWSFDTPAGQWQKTDMSDRVAWVGHVVWHFFDQTRWRRTLRVVR
ncbi:MAG TPA: signal peptidase I [Terriglobales bacterium]|nr:signal peptidase I [Terriglobales bacterium]